MSSIVPNPDNCIEPVSREASLVDEFYQEERVSCTDGAPMKQFNDPIYMLFNQKRLSLLGSGAIELWLQSMAKAKSDPLAELRKQCSDDDLLTMVKSRHLQSPSEIHAWAQLMTSKIDDFKSEVSKLLAAKQVSEEHVESEPNVVPNVEPKTE